MRDKAEPTQKPSRDQRSQRWFRDEGPRGRLAHPDFCGSGGVVKRSPFLDELDGDDE
ncbi:hypothetical protein [Mesorhizobium sp. B2-1-2]|uniref:hypothetical protein n=1 Tax=Mesorhizobium sp. B2-1-2 TaxID=2589973 RepID=UPI0017471537|nr:hypothetical protein [Mesorhizobium sp. B2-1-2]